MTIYPNKYNPKLLETVPRKTARERIGWNSSQIPFAGFDLWNCYELSFLHESGLPFVGILQLKYTVDSEFIVESKSLKLYFNSFNMTKFQSRKEVGKIIERDLQAILNTPFINIQINPLKSFSQPFTQQNSFNLIDNRESANNFTYTKDSTLLETIESKSQKLFYLYSNLLKSNCPITNQPDWGTIYIFYKTDEKEIIPESLLKYIVSFRNHNEFHEECCERILFDLKNALDPKELIVLCKYTRRGGIDINPIRMYSKDVNAEKRIPKIFEDILYSRDFRQ
ncbi:MAG: NADPH-dependent 7-cyano-7-deazaguanine reductase QueF [Candidatus Cloacimonadota bacterium]|nr:NADPH-dependent 7-cyano-7-deazaguanine reductase QueF [Candidatus Cloacimonadota bacterium]